LTSSVLFPIYEYSHYSDNSYQILFNSLVAVILLMQADVPDHLSNHYLRVWLKWACFK
jgi:hypothetical protein